MPRPLPAAVLGRVFRAPREARGWTQRQAAEIGKRKGLTKLSHSMLSLLESGRVRTPTKSVVEAVAELYEVEYAPLASEVAAAVYNIDSEKIRSRDLLRPAIGVESASKTPQDTDGHGGQNPSVGTEERTRALEAGLWDIIGTALELVGTTGITLDDLRATTSRVGRAGEEAPREGARHRAHGAQAVGARR